MAHDAKHRKSRKGGAAKMILIVLLITRLGRNIFPVLPFLLPVISISGNRTLWSSMVPAIISLLR